MNRRRSLLSPSNQGLILWLDALKGNAPQSWRDISGNGNNGQLIGDVAYADNCYKVNNTIQQPSYIKVDSSDILFSPDKSFTLQILFKTNQECNIMGTVINGDAVSEFWTTGSVRAAARFLNQRFPSGGEYSINVTDFTLFTAAFDSAVNKLEYYFNDTQVYSGQGSSSAADRQGMTLGYRSGAPTKNAVSYYASVRYYTRSLTADEVRRNYEFDIKRYKEEV